MRELPTFQETESDRDLKNILLLQAAAEELRQCPMGREAIKVECFNKSEADRVKAWAGLNLQTVKIYYTWMFDDQAKGTPKPQETDHA